MARLRNRILKADFWGDGELLRWPREKRFTYAGLYALAEDSGVVEDDVFNWKCMIWPSPFDNDITIEDLEQWRDELCEAGKLVPYHAEGQQLLFIKAFHEHEHPRNPQSPSLPLPDWIRWVPNANLSYKGHYEVSAMKTPRKRKTVVSASQKKESTEVAKATDNGDDSFDDFWEAYPRHEAKEKAKVAWARATKSEHVLAIGVAQVMNALVENGSQEKQFVPHATTFIHGKRWEDWREGIPAGWQDESADRAAQQQATIEAAILAAYKEEQ
jgi:hypothetical protein